MLEKCKHSPHLAVNLHLKFEERIDCLYLRQIEQTILDKREKIY